mgnify:CR=1 FL=1
MVSKAVFHTEQLTKHFDGTLNKLHYAVLMAAADNDTYTLKEMLL